MPSAKAEACTEAVTRATLVPCALEANLDVRVEHANAEAMEGRKTASSVLLPANPVLAISGADRRSRSDAATNWYATLSQEIEIAGQRGSRVRAADAALLAQEKRVLVTKRDAAALAWTAYFEVLAAHDALRLAEHLLATSERIGVAVRARAESGLAAAVDADLADAAALRILQTKLAAEQAAATANARLALVLGRAPTRAQLHVEGELVPLQGFDARPTPAPNVDRPEVQVVDAERSAALARAEVFRRARVPSPTVSAFAQSDGFNERVLGLGVSLPIPLPSPIGRTYAGEIAEAEALARRAAIEKTRTERALELAIADGYAAYAAHLAAVRAMPAERMKQVEARIEQLHVEIETGRLSIRDALIAQQSLIELLQANINERRALCLASVALARALGVPLEGGVQ